MSWMKQKSESEPMPGPPAPMHTPSQPMPAMPRREPPMSQVVNVGKSVEIKGELTGDEDLVLEGRVEGRIRLPNHKLTIGANARIDAEVSAKTVMVLGQVHGNIHAEDMVDVAPSGSVEGDIAAPRVSIADGARFQGRIDMQQRPGAASSNATTERPRTERPKPDMVMAG